MAQRDQLGRAFGCLDSCDPCGGQHVPLGDLVVVDRLHRGRLHTDLTTYTSDTVRDLLGGDIDHLRLTGVVEVGELVRHGNGAQA